MDMFSIRQGKKGSSRLNRVTVYEHDNDVSTKLQRKDFLSL